MTQETQTRNCPKCGTPVALTPARIKHGRYTCNACSNKVVQMWAENNRERHLASANRRAKAYQARHPERLPTKEQKRNYDRRYHLGWKYGITPEQYDEMLVAQGGCCALCGSSDPQAVFDRFHIDHSHETGRVRGLLCAKCNLGLGSLGDTVESLQRAIDYIKRTGG